MNRDELPAAVIVAGGGSRRMGRDKALLRLPDGKTTLGSVVAVAKGVASPVFLSVDTLEHADRLGAGDLGGVELLIDRQPGAGPLLALAGALHVVTAPALLLLPVDMPLLTPAVLQLLFDTWRDASVGQIAVAAPQIGGVTYPLPACYGSDLSGVVDELVSTGRRALRAVLEHPAVRLRLLPEPSLRRADPTLRSLAAANTPAEWADLCAAEAPGLGDQSSAGARSS